ncbi:MAG: erythromycin esterase family protein [Acidobacteriota bacterium]
MASTNHRDKGMAGNVGVLANSIYKDKKIILWAHNFHISRNAADTLEYEGIVNMGRWLSEKFQSQLYVLGLFMYQGTAAWNNRSVYTLTDPLPNSTEAILSESLQEYCFVDMLGQENTAGTSWMFQAIPYKEWGWGNYVMTPRNQYDGLLFIRNVNPPTYLPRGAARLCAAQSGH